MRPVAQLMDLSGRRALVTGGAGHVGLAVAEVLLELGATLTILDREANKLKTRAAQLALKSWKGKIVPCVCDLSDEPETRRAVRRSIATMGGLDVLIHCAAFVGTTKLDGWAVPFSKQTVKAWDQALKVNLTSAFVLVQEAKEALSARGRGSVIFFASTYGVVGPDMRLYDKTLMAHPAGYGASKGGLLQLTRYLAALLAPTIRINAVTPGGIRRKQPKVFQKRYIKRTPLGRMATEEDLKGAVAYLASDLSAYVTGHNLVVDGGWTVW